VPNARDGELQFFDAQLRALQRHPRDGQFHGWRECGGRGGRRQRGRRSSSRVDRALRFLPRVFGLPLLRRAS